MAAYNEEVVIESAVASLLAFDYPEFEVDRRQRRLVGRHARAAARGVRPRAVRGVRAPRLRDAARCAAIYRSAIHPNLVVVDKENGGKADAWNAALNVARYRYVCGVDADTRLRPEGAAQGDACSPCNDPGAHHRRDEPDHDGARAGAAILAQPVGVAAGRRRPARRLPAPRLRARVLQQPARVVAAGLHALLARAAFQIWRRDVLEEVGGYSRQFTCEDIELTFRIHERYLREGRDYEIRCLTGQRRR